MSSPDLKFILGQALSTEESRHIEFKEVKGPNPFRSIIEVADEYAVAFLNSEGGSIYWGISDQDQIVVGVRLELSERDRLKKDVLSKLNGIQPQIDPSRFRFTIHPIIGAADNIVVVELAVPTGHKHEPYFTSGHEVFVRTDGRTQKLSGPQLTDWIRTRSGTGEFHQQRDIGVEPAVAAVAQRIRRIFSAHGLGPGHWARFFEITKAPFSIKLTDLQSDHNLLAWLSEDKIQWISQTFLVRRAWIDGEDERIHEQQSYDKAPNKFLSIISRHTDPLIVQDIPAGPIAFFIRWGLGSDWMQKNNAGVFVFVAVPLAHLSHELTVYKYIGDFEPYGWDEGRTAVQLRAWARLLFVTKGIPCIGREVSHELGEQIWDNSVFLPELIEDYSKMPRCRHYWSPEDYALYPKESVQAKNDEFFSGMISFLQKHGLPHNETRLFGGERSNENEV